MDYITQILNWISMGLLLPTIILLLFAMAGALFALGSFIAQSISMLHEKQNARRIIKNFCDSATLPEEQDKCLFARLVKKMAKDNFNQLKCEKLISDLKSEYDRDLEKVKFITKIGPMLGLMGTLIPMGPALAGLASGNIESMAYNMQIAFATTVVGCFAAGIGLLIYSVKKHWYNDEINNLIYLLEWQINYGNNKNQNQ